MWVFGKDEDKTSFRSEVGRIVKNAWHNTRDEFVNEEIGGNTDWQQFRGEKIGI